MRAPRSRREQASCRCIPASSIAGRRSSAKRGARSARRRPPVRIGGPKETKEGDASGNFPLLARMSVIAGRMAIEAATKHLGHAPANVLVLGAGHAGSNAAEAARAAGATVTVLRRADATPQAIERAALAADLVVG